jgi:hypothetical protein
VRCPALTLAIAGGLLAAAVVGAQPAPDFKQRRRTERVTYFVAKGRKADVARTEAFLDRLETLFGAAPAGWHVDYYVHRAQQLSHPQSSYAAFGITDLESLRIDSVREYHPHELVHAVAGTIGRAPLFFAEGLAVALTSEGQWHGASLDARARRALARNASLERYLTAFSQQDPDEAYSVAGSFVAYLLDRFGIDPMIGFLRRCGDGSGSFETAFRGSYDLTVARASIEWSEALGQAPSEQRAWYHETSWPTSLRRDLPRADALGLDGAVPTARVGCDLRGEGLLEPCSARLAEAAVRDAARP